MNIDKEEYSIAKPAKRIVAFLIDLVINFVVSVILLIPALFALINVLITKNNPNILALFIASLISGALIIAFVILYFVALPVFWEGQTVGKRFLSIRIVDVRTNQGPNARVMFIRESIRIVVCILTFGLSTFASFIVLLISDKHTTFHEQLSSTVVVNASNEEKTTYEDF